MTIEDMQKRKKELGYSNEQLSKLSGVPLGTLQKVLGGTTKSPRRSTVLALEAVLKKQGTSYVTDTPAPAGVLREAAVPYHPDRMGPYTLEDYYALPDDQRVELIDGYFFAMEAPSALHQKILLLLWKILYECIEEHGCPCEVLAAPFDVQLDKDNKTMVQPDVMIMCNMEDFSNKRHFGAPDFAAEVLSPSSRRKDMFIKLYKYRFAGVREYWIIDPQNRKIQVYDLEHDSFAKTYCFTDKIPLLISGEKCTVDFSMIDKAVQRYYEAE